MYYCIRCDAMMPDNHVHTATNVAEVQSNLFDMPVDDGVFEGPGQARRTDPETSHAAAQLVKARATSARVLLLAAFYSERFTDGLTDEEAAEIAGVSLRSEYATRCSELRRGGMIAVTGTTRTGASGASREVSKITALGMSVMAERAG